MMFLSSLYHYRFLVVCIAVAAAATPSTSGRATDYIDCSLPCPKGDVNYDLYANVRNIPLMNYTYRGRTFSEPGSDSIFGPTIHVSPGQSLHIKLWNNLTDPTIGPNPVTAMDYWRMLQKPGEKIKYQYYKPPVNDPSLLNVDTPNIPTSFDATNLHLHGLDIEVHMFDPVGTHNPDAPHIAIQPNQCYCYQFNIPEHHPTGMYWYHPHLHGSTAVQMWGGMIGLLYVDGPLEDELANYGVTHTEEFVIWDPALQAVEGKSSHNVEVDEFLQGQTTLSKIHPFLVNGKYIPTMTANQHEVVHFRVLSATVENENTFIVYKEGEDDMPWEEVALPFWVIATDGVTHPENQPPTKKQILVLAGGQRHEVLLQFPEPGNYVISQQGIQGMQFFDMYGHPHDQVLMKITVLPADASEVGPKIPIEEMRFTPGYPTEDTISAEEIAASETIVFSMGANRDQAPFPQYYVNGQSFEPNRLDFYAEPGQAREYILINANHNVHPFHIHVNRFQVQEMGSELSTEKYPVLKHVMEYDPNEWRDTVVVPPNGRARIWVRYMNYTGKTVFHCHFLAHEDTGMMSTLFIGPPDPVFRWEEHTQLMIGIGFGILLVIVGAYMAMVLGIVQNPNKDYDAVSTMNEIKHKVVD